MTTEEATELLGMGTDFDYLKGRPIKVDLDQDEIDETDYDQVNGDGAAWLAINARNIPEVIRGMHQAGLERSSVAAKASMQEPATFETRGDVQVFTLTLSDVADVLGPAVEKARGTNG